MPADLDLPHHFDPDCACDLCEDDRRSFVDACHELWLDALDGDLTLDQDLFGGDGSVFGEVA